LLLSSVGRGHGLIVGWESPVAAAAGVLAVLAFYYSVSSHLVDRWQLLKLRRAALPADSPAEARRELQLEAELMLRRLPAFRIGVDVLILSLYAAQLFIFGWVDFVAQSVPVYLDVLPNLAPYFAMLAASWVGQYRIERKVRGNDWRPARFIGFQTRANIMTVMPIALIYFVYWALLYFVPSTRDLLAAFYFLQVVLQVALVIGVSIFIPLGVRLVLPGGPLPDGRLRRRLESFARDQGIRISQILVWRTGSRMFATAFVIGLLSPFRYVFITDALLKRLSDDEILAVYAHELGHVKHRHLWWLLGFIISFTTILLAAEQLMPATGESTQLLAVAAVLAYGYFLFGYVSRRFERDADAFAAKTTSPELISQVFLKLGMDNPSAMKKQGWRHFSLERRVREIILQKAHPELRRIFRAELWRGLALGVIATLGSLALLALPVRDDVVSGLATYSLNRFDDARAKGARPERLEELRVQTIQRSQAMAGLNDDYAWAAAWYEGIVEGLSGRESDALDEMQALAKEKQSSAETPEERALWGREIRQLDATRAAIANARRNGTPFFEEFDAERARRGLR
jgi:Zn-dependent protease with chaperone function